MARSPMDCRIKITLDGLRPPIWRRVVAPSCVTLSRFHDILQIAMGWANCHRHRFQRESREFGPAGPSGDSLVDARGCTLKHLLARPGDSIRYEYDFRDGWRHTVVLEEVIARAAGPPQTRCIGGERACPPEDCGGVQGYVALLEAIHDPFHARHLEMLAWAGKDFDPQAFDMAAVNRSLASRGQGQRARFRLKLAVH
jgi:hypothetical protein